MWASSETSSFTSAFQPDAFTSVAGASAYRSRLPSAILACPALQTSSINSARRMVSKIVAPKSRRLGMRRALVPFFGGRFFGGSNGGGCRGSDGRPSSGTAGAAAEREQRQYQPDRERENRRLAAHSHYHCPHYRFHDARPLQRATVNDEKKAK